MELRAQFNRKILFEISCFGYYLLDNTETDETNASDTEIKTEKRTIVSLDHALYFSSMKPSYMYVHVSTFNNRSSGCV